MILVNSFMYRAWTKCSIKKEIKFKLPKWAPFWHASKMFFSFTNTRPNAMIWVCRSILRTPSNCFRTLWKRQTPSYWLMVAGKSSFSRKLSKSFCSKFWICQNGPHFGMLQKCFFPSPIRVQMLWSGYVEVSSGPPLTVFEHFGSVRHPHID